MKKILIINGHPDKESFCFHLADTPIKSSDDKKRKKWLEEVAELGRQQK